MKYKSIFVIGAGASKEAGLPTGAELKRNISSLLEFEFDSWGSLQKGDKRIVDTLYKLEENINPFLTQARHIREALPLAISIDNFIDSQRENEKLAVFGKLAIARAILEAEKQSKMFFAPRNPNGRENSFDFEKLEQTWYYHFFQLLTENCSKEDLEERFKSVVLIIFNYDRCIEYFLCEALENYYRVSQQEAADIIKNITIYHPYGSVGSLPWQKAELPIYFGATPNVENLVALISKIKTFTEGTDPGSSEIMALRGHMADANKLVFLGFAFHKLNIQLISPNKGNLIKAPKVFATAYGISRSDQKFIIDQIKEMYRKEKMPQSEMSIEISTNDCNSFFSEYSRSLSF